MVYGPNVTLDGKSHADLYIPTGSRFSDVCRILDSSGMLGDTGSFRWVALRKRYDRAVKPGRYRIADRMSSNALVNMLRAGRQEPVLLVFNSVRTPADLAGRIARRVEPDSVALLHAMNDAAFLRNFGCTPQTVFTLFIPNTYQVYWNTSVLQLFRRMATERDRFWNSSRREALERSGLTQVQAVILASIVEKETAMDREKPVIAGIYLNRLRKGWPLQADPTLIYAWNDYSIRRVMEKHKQIRSPYNTYRRTGLPPGPICLPSVASIDAVLFFKAVPYMYFCAKEDFSGYHNFAVTLAEHNRNARRYQEALKRITNSHHQGTKAR